MGVELSYRQVTPQEFERLHFDDEYAQIFFGVELETDEEILTRYEVLISSDRYLDLDKHWQTLYLLLTGQHSFDQSREKTLLHTIFMGGTETQWEATYGMVRHLKASEVREMAEALNQFAVEDCFKVRLAKLYDSSPDTKAYMEPHFVNLFTQVVNFFNQAMEAGNTVLLSFN